MVSGAWSGWAMIFIVLGLVRAIFLQPEGLTERSWKDIPDHFYYLSRVPEFLLGVFHPHRPGDDPRVGFAEFSQRISTDPRDAVCTDCGEPG